jgi:DNA polymerase-3 subunit beta
MELSITKAELQQGLGRVQSIVEKRNAMPILAHVLLAAVPDDDGCLEISATDLEVGIQGRHEARVQKPGSITVGARKLYEITRELADEEIHLKAAPNGFLEIRCARSHFTLAGTAAEEFPSLPTVSPKRVAQLQASVLSTMIERTVYAASVDETRYNLNGVYLEILEDQGKLRMVATDGHRLAYVDRSIGEEAAAITSGVILPRKALAELRRLVDEEDADEVELGFEGSNAVARKGRVTLVMRLIEGEFPNYRQVVPSKSKHRLVVDTAILERALRRVVLLSAERSRAVRLEFSTGRLLVSSSHPDLGEAHDELDVAYRGEELNIGFNARYVLDSLAAFASKEVEVLLADELSPVVLHPTGDPDTLAVVMPMRL